MTHLSITIRPLLAGIGLSLLSACATTGSETRGEAIAELLDDPRVGEKVDRICFRRGIDGFSDATDYSVVLRRGVNDEYLVVTRVCPELDFAQSLALDGSSSCVRQQDYLRVFRSAFGPSELDTATFNRCFIDAIYKWDDDALDAEEEDDADE